MERCYSITARVEGRGSPLPVGQAGAWEWEGFGLTVNYEVLDVCGCPFLALRFNRYGRPTKQVIALDSTRPHYGGARWWFDCLRCERRVRDLHLAGNSYTFACRHCLGLSYESAQATRSSIFFALCTANARYLGVTRGAARRFVREHIGGYVHRPRLIGEGLLIPEAGG